MTIFQNNVRRIFRSKLQFFFIILFPLLFMQISNLIDEPTNQVRVAIIDRDQSPLTTALMRNLKSKVNLLPVEESHIEKQLMSLKLDYVLVIPHGFTDSVI